MAKLIALIETNKLRGAGTHGDPARNVRQLWTLDGELGHHPGGVRLKQTKVTSRVMSAAQIDQALRLYGEGVRTGELARRFGVSKTTIRKLLKKSGTALRGIPGKTDAQRFWDYVRQNPETGCWDWVGAHTGRGYAYFNEPDPDPDKPHSYRSVRAHRWAYEFLVGPVPDGKDLDHLCHNRGCVNPAHLDPVTHRENMLRSPDTIPSRAKRGELVGIHLIRAVQKAWPVPDAYGSAQRTQGDE